MKNISWPKLVKKPSGVEILVLAPHMDDEIIGCGGTLLKHSQAGDKISVVYMTDGSKGIPGKQPNYDLIKLRKEEAMKSNTLLGIQDVIFLDIEDSSDESWESYEELLYNILIDNRPELIYLPWYLDIHPDHQKTNFLLKKIVEKSQFKCTVCAYEVWYPLNPNILVNITKQMPVKLQAISEHKSQLELIKYSRLITSLNSYRACFIPLPGLDYAEAFYESDCQSYLELINYYMKGIYIAK
ncbi:MAG: PIG-L family deacetylase [Firmicutes bacterium]|nr:PIG-L family deacetylase [Bacillota bacterium]